MKLYPFVEECNKRSEDFRVLVSGYEAGVYSCDVSAYPLNRVWGGKQRDMSQTEKASFVMFGSDSAIMLEIIPEREFEEVTVRPLSKNITPSVIDGKIQITFPGCGQYSIELDGMHNPLVVFINPEKDFEVDITSPDVLYFGKGIHTFTERIELRDNQTVFIDEGAVLYGSLNASCKKNIKVVGYGILDNSLMKRANEINGCAILAPDAGKDTGNPIFFDRCENIEINGITIVNSSGWNVYLDGCKNIIVDNIKLIGQWRYNADGCDFCNCINGTIKNSFLRTFDDCITVKGFKLNNKLPVENILAENCVLWCDWGKAIEIGCETCAPYLKNMTFRDCDVIHGGSIMLDIAQGDGGDIDNVLFEDIRLEYSGCEMFPAIQFEDSTEYVDFEKEFTPSPFCIIAGVTMWSIDDYCGNMTDVRFKDIKILAYEGILFERIYDGNLFGNSKIKADEKYGKISGVHFENVTINGRKCEFSELGIEVCDGIENVTCDGEEILR